MPELTSAAAAEPVTASPSARTISGRIVPYGPAGQTSQGLLTFSPGALRWSDPKRVKLLREHHQQGDVVGYAAQLEERPDGLYATFHIPETAAGDQALLEATHGLRDAFSVGVQIDPAAGQKLRRANGAPVAGSGALREVSLVSVPAFDDARVEHTAASSGALTVSAWSDASTTPTEPDAPAPAEPSREDNPMPDTVEPDAPTAPVTTDPAPAVVPAPVSVVAAAGAALVTGEPATYTFDGHGPSIVQDAMNATNDPDAAGRLARFNTELVHGNPASVMALAAVATRSTLDELVNPSVRRPDLLLEAIDTGRPIWSRLGSQRLANAQPFLLPVEGEFSGVGAHTEGTAHVAEGTMTFSEVTVTPQAVSGAYRISRELSDSANPSVERIVVAAMLRDYARVSEALAVTGLTSGAGAAVTGINTLAELRAQLIDYAGDNGYNAAVVVAGNSFFTNLAVEVDGDGRALLPFLGPQNSSGQLRAGYTGAVVDGVEIVRSSSVATGEAFILPDSGVFVGESPVQTFRFEQPEGPGIIKLALFAYQVAAVTRAGSVRRLTAA